MSGLFVSFEGVDGAGKSSIMREVALFLQQNLKIKVFLTKEPADNKIGDYVKKAVFEQPNLNKEYQSYLFLADRLHHLQTKINPAIEAGELVLCDRYHDSTIAYQGQTKEKRDFFYKMYNWDILRIPDLTIWIDTKIDILQRRLAKRAQKNLFDQQPKDFFLQIKQNYLWLFEKEPKRIIFIENNTKEKQAVEAVKTAIINFLDL